MKEETGQSRQEHSQMALIAQHYQQLVKTARMLVGKQQTIATIDPEDLVHLVWERLKCQPDHTLQNETQLLAYFRQAMKNTLISELRRENRKKRGGDVRKIDIEKCINTMNGGGRD